MTFLRWHLSEINRTNVAYVNNYFVTRKFFLEAWASLSLRRKRRRRDLIALSSGLLKYSAKVNFEFICLNLFCTRDIRNFRKIFLSTFEPSKNYTSKFLNNFDFFYSISINTKPFTRTLITAFATMELRFAILSPQAAKQIITRIKQKAEGRPHPECWPTWAQSTERASLTPTGRSVAQLRFSY